MILRYAHLSRHGAVFQAMTGLTVAAFDDLISDLLLACVRAKQQHLARPILASWSSRGCSRGCLRAWLL